VQLLRQATPPRRGHGIDEARGFAPSASSSATRSSPKNRIIPLGKITPAGSSSRRKKPHTAYVLADCYGLIIHTTRPPALVLNWLVERRFHEHMAVA
jgi:hypothetical protein